ncbi:hypothetical protein HGRIS_006181 [Hohenbuehelia grisea]|uniref:BTB domain-containing protein n=1 Tax=Hohenbuehelia grisea TaxID=104357 RepID=A0ABR3K083_9AGAR
MLGRQFSVHASSLCAQTPSVPKVTVDAHLNIDCARKDEEYYFDESKAGFCTFLVEDALFRVHRFVLARDSSTFEDMFSLPKTPGTCSSDDEGPVSLSDTAEQFRDLLWALYALPSQLQISQSSSFQSLPSLNRLLNIAELAHKYNFTSFEDWALAQILALASSPSGPLCTGSSATCARIIHIAALTGHAQLSTLASDAIVRRLLAGEVDPSQTLLSVANHHGLRKLRGAVLYTRLLSLENSSLAETPRIDRKLLGASERVGYLNAFQSLVRLWERLRVSPPSFSFDECDNHEHFVGWWREMWLVAGRSEDIQRKSSADVLGRLECMGEHLRERVLESGLPLECALAALEGVSSAFESCMENLDSHFCEP